MPPKKIILKTEDDTNFILTAIVTPLPSYRIAWYVNNSLSVQLKKANDVVITDALNKFFVRYWYNESITKSEFWLIENRNDGSMILQELKEMDYLLMIKGNYYHAHQKELLKKILKIKQVQTAVIINVQELKSRNNLIELVKISNMPDVLTKHL